MPHSFDSYRRLTPRSRELYARARTRIPGGVTSNVRFFEPYPIFMARGQGSKIYDVDGREYIDYCLAFGPLIAGHGHPRIHDAIRAELERAGTVILGASSELELRLADRLAALLPSAEMVRFTNSGTEATMHAIRIAHGFTGARRVVKFEGHYHGGHDWVLANVDRPGPLAPYCDGIPQAVLDSLIVLPFNDISAMTDALEHAGDVAAVIVEPVARGVIEADQRFLAALRELTARRGIVLIFDEVVSWPRVSLRGAQGLYGVTPDLTALGKAIGGGLPMGAVVGRRDIMSTVIPRGARDSGSGTSPYVFHGGTYNGTPAALAAGLALLDLLEEPGVYAGLMAAGERMRRALCDLFARRGREAQVIGIGAAVDFYFTRDPIRSSREIWRSDLDARRALDYRLLEAGIYNSPLHRYHLSLAHTNADLARTIDTIERALP